MLAGPLEGLLFLLLIGRGLGLERDLVDEAKVDLMSDAANPRFAYINLALNSILSWFEVEDSEQINSRFGSAASIK